jgi:hypothetical protein
MTPEEFVAAIRQSVFDSAASEGALQPRGRQPHEVLIQMWDWYTALPGHDQAHVQRAMRIAAYSALFGFFVVLDGVRAIDQIPHGELRLIYTDHDGNEQQLNRPEVEELHALWPAEVFPYTEPLSLEP